jgi:hypothetical protein
LHLQAGGAAVARGFNHFETTLITVTDSMVRRKGVANSSEEKVLGLRLWHEEDQRSEPGDDDEARKGQTRPPGEQRHAQQEQKDVRQDRPFCFAKWRPED